MIITLIVYFSGAIVAFFLMAATNRLKNTSIHVSLFAAIMLSITSWIVVIFHSLAIVVYYISTNPRLRNWFENKHKDKQ